MRTLLLAVAILLAPPLARACDTDAMNAELTRVCRAALDPVLGWLDGVVVPEAERGRIAAARAAAADACDMGDPAIGALAAVQLARLAGRLEAQPARPASFTQH